MASKAGGRGSAGARQVPCKDRAPASPGRAAASSGFPIAVAGASAGGLEAFRRLLSALPAQTGMAFILVPHLDPTRESRMVELLAASSAMPVAAATDGQRIRPNHVYVIPPNRLLAVHGGRIVLTRLPHPRTSRTALDFAMRSLVEDQGANAVGIVLSGTGSLGASGLEEVIRAGGLGLAQDPVTAQYEQMPRSAATAGVPPHNIMAPESMAAVLLTHTHRRAPGGARAAASSPAQFFHHPEALDAFAAAALPNLVARATAALPVRVWVPECGTGEEAYSVAMLLLERLDAAGKNGALKVFASDPDTASLRAARHGIYPKSTTGTVSPERLSRFFQPLSTGQYKIDGDLRQRLVFGQLDLFADPPISKLDLLVCRAPLGDRRRDEWAGLISRLHFALHPGGYLLLAPGVPAAEVAGLFETVSARASLYRRNGHARDPRGRARILGRAGRAGGRSALSRLLDLEHARDDLEVSSEQMTSMNEELRSANEDLQSANQEMRTMNEELESSRSILQERTATAERVEAQLRAVLDGTADAVVAIDTDGKIATFNGSASRVFGYALHEVIGRHVNMLLPPELRSLHDDFLARYRKTHQRHVIGTSREVVACRRDGTRFPALLSVSETADAHLLVGCLRDLTADKALQEEVLNIAALEQQRIGQELHDGTQQELTGLGLLAQGLSEELQKSRSANADLASRVATGIAEANRHVRSLARGLVPAPVDADTLPAALGELARNTQETYKLACRLDCAAPLKMPDAATATHLYRIAQEAVGNAAKHSKADDVLIRLAHDEDRLRLEIHDNGIGIPARRPANGGVGLRLMEHRCAAVGGRFLIGPRAGGGTVVSCTVPFLGRA